MNVLLIEDQVALSDALCQSLKNENYSVTPKYDGEEGLFEALTGIYDVIILDVMLPLKNGFDVLKELRAEKITTPSFIESIICCLFPVKILTPLLRNDSFTSSL